MFGKIGRAIGKYSGANLAVKGVKKLGAPATAVALAPMTLGGSLLAGTEGGAAAAERLKQRRQERTARIKESRKLRT